MSNQQSVKGWDEDSSRTFLDYGCYFVPERERQIGIIGDLILPPPAGVPGGALLVELCSGEGLMSRALLERFPACRMLALGGDAGATRATCGAMADRLTVAAFDLASRDWRAFAEASHAIVSSLAIHHLDGGEKRALFRDMAAALASGGVLVIADIVRPPDARGLAAAAQDVVGVEQPDGPAGGVDDHGAAHRGRAHPPDDADQGLVFPPDDHVGPEGVGDPSAEPIG